MWLGDPLYYTTVLPPLVISVWANVRRRAVFQKGTTISPASGLSGAELAARMLEGDTTAVKCVSGPLSNYYDSRGRVVRLSAEVFHGRNLTALGIAAHESGHAIQHAAGARVAVLARSLIVPIATLGSQVCWMFCAAGYVLGMLQFVLLAIALFSANVILQLANLVIEHSASRCAMTRLRALDVMDEQELATIEQIMLAAPMAYLAATLTGITELFALGSGPRRVSAGCEGGKNASE